MAGRGRPQVQRGGGRFGVQRGRETSATKAFHIGVPGEGSREDDLEFEGHRRGRPAPRVDFSGDLHQVRGRGRSWGAGPGARPPAAEDSASPPPSQVSPPNNLGLDGFSQGHLDNLGLDGLGNEHLGDVRTVGRGRGRGTGPVRPTKGKNFVLEEERQLTRSVLAISQDPICGNQQKGNAYWERIFLHYDQCRPGGHRGARSLESKWGTIKHDVGKFIGAYNQIKRLNKSGSKEADIIRMAKDLYRTKSPKNTEFMFEHCWELVKDFPRWADGVSPSRQPTPSRRLSGSSDHESQSGSQVDTQKSVNPVDTTGEATTSMAFTYRPSGTKATKDGQRADKVHKIAALTQAKAAEKMAEATLRKAASLEYHNMLLLFTAPMDQVTTPEAQEFIRLLREEELVKLRRRRTESAAVELREQRERELSEAAEAAQERQEAANRLREDEETHRQLWEARGEFVQDDEECDPELHVGGGANSAHPGDTKVVEL
jgi:hypothetical protein